MHTNLSYRNLNSFEAFEEAIVFFDQKNEKELYSCAINRALASTILLYKKYNENNVYDKKIELKLKSIYSSIMFKYIRKSDISIARKIYFKIFHINPWIGLALYKLKNILRSA